MQKIKPPFLCIGIGIFTALFCFVPFALSVQAQSMSVDELRERIEATQREKQRLEEENRKLQVQIQETHREAQTLQTAVKSLDTTQRKLQSDIQVTQTKIKGAELTIQKLDIEIGGTENGINQSRQAIAEALRNIYETNSQTTVEILLRNQDIGQVWNDIETLNRFQASMRDRVATLQELKIDLENKQKENAEQKQSLEKFQGDLSEQKSAVDENKAAKDVLLKNTQNKEAEYRRMLQRNIELGRKFEQELFQFESELRIQIDRSKLPTERSGVLAWPLDSVFITQRFGKTVDSQRLYVSGTHNGVDFRAAMGTPVKSVLAGVVQAIGNTDDQPGCYSYGRWVLVKHNNGLSSMYAHLSSARVSPGQVIAQGDTVGLSGGQPGTPGAGFSTGPHLHLGLFATEGVTVMKYTNSRFCKNVSIPIASTEAYLDPLAYLPPLN